MTTIDHSTGPVRFTTRASLAQRIAAVVANGFRALKNRRAFYRLSELTDAELEDIGLTRADLSVAGGLGLAEDPTLHLGAIAEGRAKSAEHAARMVG
jgi:uncharacterized protein YjiS (DUF1127 family)